MATRAIRARERLPRMRRSWVTLRPVDPTGGLKTWVGAGGNEQLGPVGGPYNFTLDRSESLTSVGPVFQATREITLLATHLTLTGLSSQVVDANRFDPPVAGLSVLHGGQASITQAPFVLSGDLPDDWPVIVFLTPTAGFGTNVIYSGSVMSKAKRKLAVGEQLYVSVSGPDLVLGYTFACRVLIGYR